MCYCFPKPSLLTSSYFSGDMICIWQRSSLCALFDICRNRQGRSPTCPMCNHVIEMEVLYRLPLPWLMGPTHADQNQPVIPVQAQVRLTDHL